MYTKFLNSNPVEAGPSKRSRLSHGDELVLRAAVAQVCGTRSAFAATGSYILGYILGNILGLYWGIYWGYVVVYIGVI